MTKLSSAFTVALFVAPAAASASATQLKAGELTLTVDPKGCGFIDALTFKGREVVRARRGFVGGYVALATAGDGSAESLFANAVAVVLPAKIATVSANKSGLTVRGAYSNGKASVPFTRQLAIGKRKNAITVREEADFSGLSDNYVVAKHSLDLPLVVCQDEHLRMFAFGGARRAELFRMDMNDERRRNQLISDNRAYWPYWDIGGVVQLHDSYSIWRANHADTMAYPIEDGRGAPGWADYSELEWGLTVEVLEPQRAAPWAMHIDAREGVFSIVPRPPSQLPIAGRDCGKRTFQFALTFHESSWPATYSCELDFELYKRLLDYLNVGKRYTHLNYVCGGVGIQLPNGRQSREQMAEVYRRVIFKERIQPSVLLRLFYRGDGWRMAGLVREVLGRRVPRNQPMQEWEKIAREFFETIKRDSLPKKQ